MAATFNDLFARFSETRKIKWPSFFANKRVYTIKEK